MKKYGKWDYNMDTACVEMKQPDGTLIAIDTLAVEREFVETWVIFCLVSGPVITA